MKTSQHFSRKATALLLLGSLLATPQTQAAMTHDTRFEILGGYNDNVNLAPEGSIYNDGSLFAHARISADLGWDMGSGSKFYVALLNDDILYLSEGEASSILLDAAPGFRFKAIGGKLDTDISAHLTLNNAFDDSDDEDDARTGNIRSTKPDLSSLHPQQVGSPSSYFAKELRVLSLYNLGSFSIGPNFRLVSVDYSKAPQEDTLMILAARALLPAAERVVVGFDLGMSENSSDIMSAEYSGMIIGADLDLKLSGGFSLNASYAYNSRDYDNTTREDTGNTLQFAVAKTMSRSTFLFDYRHFNNSSNFAGADYTANVFSAGVSWKF